MPMYTFVKSDGETVSKRLSFTQYEACKANGSTLTDKDGSVLQLVFDPGSLGFVLKDGASGGWMTKASKESQYRQARSVAMAKKERDHVFKSTLVPNYNGQEAHSWSDVRDHVRSVSGKAAAGTYDALVSKEKGS